MIKSTVSFLNELKTNGIGFKWFRADGRTRLVARVNDSCYFIGTPIDKVRMFVKECNVSLSFKE